MIVTMINLIVVVTLISYYEQSNVDNINNKIERDNIKFSTYLTYHSNFKLNFLSISRFSQTS